MAAPTPALFFTRAMFALREAPAGEEKERERGRGGEGACRRGKGEGIGEGRGGGYECGKVRCVSLRRSGNRME